MNRDTFAWLRWTLIPELGLKRSQQLLNLIDSPDTLFLHPERLPLPERIRITLREMSLLGEQHPVHRRAVQQLEWAEKSPQHDLICIDDELYPGPLEVLDDAPLVLWVRGQTSLLQRQQIAMVGSRQASPNALRQSFAMAQTLSQQGLVVTSGGALGIDSQCHQGALSGGSGTIAVLGCGVDVCYPKSHQSLFTDIADRGLLLSEYPLQTPPRPGHFPRRNRIISALATLLVVVEASRQSGTLITAQHALDQGKDIYAMPGELSNPNTAGCHQLIQDGAYLLSSADDILQHLAFQPRPVRSRCELDLTQFPPIQQQLLQLLQFGQTLSLDSLSHELGIAAHRLFEPLLELELQGVIAQHPGGYLLMEFA